jgi:PH/SEC7 domain-containing protein
MDWVDGDLHVKDMYNAVKSQQILQPQGSTLGGRSSLSSQTPGLTRNRSLRGPPNLKRGSIRGLQNILTSQNGASPYSSNSSVDGRISPSPSFATSTHEVRLTANGRALLAHAQF